MGKSMNIHSKSPVNGGFNGNIHSKWSLFHSYVKLPEGIFLRQEASFVNVPFSLPDSGQMDGSQNMARGPACQKSVQGIVPQCSLNGDVLVNKFKFTLVSGWYIYTKMWFLNQQTEMGPAPPFSLYGFIRWYCLFQVSELLQKLSSSISDSNLEEVHLGTVPCIRITIYRYIAERSL